MTQNTPQYRLAMEYARCADHRDFAAMAHIITEDFSQTGPAWSCDGAQAFIQQLDFLEQNFSATLHMVGNQVGEWQDDTYEGETYCIAHHIYERDGQARKMEMGIRYQECIVLVEGKHRYSRRDLVVVWTNDVTLNTGME